MMDGFFGWWFWPFAAAGAFVMMLIGVAAFAFWIWMIIDCIQRKFKNQSEKIVWIIVLILAGWIGALVYLFAIRVSNSHGIAKK